MCRLRVRLVALLMTVTAACRSGGAKSSAQATPVRDTAAARANHPVTHLTDLTAWVDSAVTARSARMTPTGANVSEPTTPCTCDTTAAGRRGKTKTP